MSDLRLVKTTPELRDAQLNGLQEECRALLHAVGRAWLDLYTMDDEEQRFDLARECERKCLDLSASFGQLALIFEKRAS